MKKCSACGLEKDENEFSWKNESKGKRQGRCKPCQTEYNRNYYHSKDKVKQKARVLERNKRLRQEYRDWKDTQSCKVCGESERVCLDVHHLDEDLKTMTPSRSLWGVGKDRREKELDNCVILCSNCHRKVHAGIITV